jgi:hypothetical protein
VKSTCVHCSRCHRRVCPRDGTCESKHARRKRNAELLAQGGRPHEKRCVACRETKATVAFWGGADTCRACLNISQRGTHYERKRETRMIEVRHVRLTFEQHMIRYHASLADHALVRRALARYGKADPCPDDLIEEYVRTHPTKARASDLRHAVVLLANETGIRGNADRRSEARRARGAAA